MEMVVEASGYGEVRGEALDSHKEQTKGSPEKVGLERSFVVRVALTLAAWNAGLACFSCRQPSRHHKSPLAL